MSHIVTVLVPFWFIEQIHAMLTKKSTLLLHIVFEGIRKAQARIASTFVGLYNSGFIYMISSGPWGSGINIAGRELI